MFCPEDEQVSASTCATFEVNRNMMVFEDLPEVLRCSCDIRSYSTVTFSSISSLSALDLLEVLCVNWRAELKKHVRARCPTNLTQLHQFSQEEWVKFHQTVARSLWQDTQNVFPKSNSLKAMLPNTNEMYGNI